MASANYDHPTFITRQMDNLGKTTAGANGTSLVTAYPTAMRLHRMAAVVNTAGTATTAALNAIVLNGTATSTLGTLPLGTTAANGVVISATDMNGAIPAGASFYITNAADATSVATVTVELTLDPTTASW